MILLGHRKMYKIPFLHPPNFSGQGKYKETRVPLYPQLMPSMGPGLVICTRRPACVIQVLDAADERWGEGSSRIQQLTPCLFSQLGFLSPLAKVTHSIGELNGWGPKRKYCMSTLSSMHFLPSQISDS